MRTLAIVLLAVLAGGCNSILGIPTATSAVDAAAASPDTVDGATEANPVHGMAIDTYWQPQSHLTMPRDLSTYQFTVLVPNAGAPGGFTTYHGTGTAAGTFEVPGVPDDGSTFYLEVVDTLQHLSLSPAFYIGTARTFDLSVDQLGRPFPVLTTQPSNLVLNIGNMQPYQDTDFFEVFCMNNGGSVFDFTHGTIANPPAVGADALATATFDWSQPYGAGSVRNPVIDGDLGDTLAVIQESTTTLPSGVNVQTMTRLYTEKFNQPDGTTYTINAGFIQPTAMFTLNPTIMRSQIEAHRGEVNPNTRPPFDTDVSYGDSLLPSPDHHAQYAGTLDLLVSNLVAGTTDVAYGAFSYPDPFPSAWAHLRLSRFVFGVRFAVDGGSMGGLNRAWAIDKNLDFTPAVTLDDVVAPTMSPVTTPLVNGSDAFATGMFAAGTPPVVSWSLPQLGTPVRYDVEVVNVFNDTGRTRFTTVARFATTEHSVQIPTGLLVTGSHYAFVISDESSLDGANGEVAPVITNLWTAM